MINLLSSKKDVEERRQGKKKKERKEAGGRGGGGGKQHLAIHFILHMFKTKNQRDACSRLCLIIKEQTKSE